MVQYKVLKRKLQHSLVMQGTIPKAKSGLQLWKATDLSQWFTVLCHAVAITWLHSLSCQYSSPLFQSRPVRCEVRQMADVKTAS